MTKTYNLASRPDRTHQLTTHRSCSPSSSILSRGGLCLLISRCAPSPSQTPDSSHTIIIEATTRRRELDIFQSRRSSVWGQKRKICGRFFFFVCALTIDPPRGSRFRRREKKRGPECVVWSVPSRSSRIRFGGVDVPTTTELGGEGEEWSSHFCEISDLLRNLSCWPRPRSDCGGHGPGKMVQD